MAIPVRPRRARLIESPTSHWSLLPCPRLRSRHSMSSSYNSRERQVAEPIAQALRQRKLKVFFDRWELAPGYPFLGKLEEGDLEVVRPRCFSSAPTGWGPWQEQWEKRFALTRMHHEPAFPVIPVFLPGAGDLPLDFLLLQTGIDLREGVDDPIKLDGLAAACQRRPVPGPEPQLSSVCPYRGLVAFRARGRAVLLWTNGGLRSPAEEGE